MLLGGVELAVAVVGAGEVHVRRVVVAEALEDRAALVDALAVDVAQAVVVGEPLVHHARDLVRRRRTAS